MNLFAIYRKLALFIVAMMLTSSVSISMDLHLCQGKIESFGIFSPAQSCCKKNDQMSCDKVPDSCCHSSLIGVSWSQKPCCTNANILLQNPGYLEDCKSRGDNHASKLNILDRVAANAFSDFNTSTEGDHDFHPHKPPIPKRNSIILFQSFLN